MTPPIELLDGFTVNELVTAALDKVAFKRAAVIGPSNSAAGRDYSLAITYLEDGLTRYNSGCYHEAGTWTRRDPDKAAV